MEFFCENRRTKKKRVAIWFVQNKKRNGCFCWWFYQPFSWPQHVFCNVNFLALLKPSLSTPSSSLIYAYSFHRLNFACALFSLGFQVLFFFCLCRSNFLCVFFLFLSFCLLSLSLIFKLLFFLLVLFLKTDSYIVYDDMKKIDLI